MNARSRKTHSRGGGLRVMVTGATGFLGFHTARALHQAGHRLRRFRMHIYPGMIAGPEDPGLSEGMHALATQLNLRVSLAAASHLKDADYTARLPLRRRGNPAARARPSTLPRRPAGRPKR